MVNYDSLKNMYGKLDYLINNANISIDGFIEDYSDGIKYDKN